MTTAATTSTMFREFTSGYVSRVELENFKSWKGKQHIGPFHSGFTAVIGPNGAGKSNLMDSISFVTGLKAKRLRGDALKDLIYDADKLAEEENRRMSVTMAYRLGEGEVPGKRAGEEIIFKRVVQYHTPGCEYHIGSRRVTYEEYEEMFNQLNVLTSARNFLIFQGDVEATAAKSPMELTLLFEQISGSDKYKQEYELLEKEKDRMDTVTLDKIAQAKLAKQERKEAKEQKEVTDRFNSLAAQCEQVGQEFALFQLQQAEGEMEVVRNKLDQAKDQVAELEAVEEASAEDAKQQKSKVALEARGLAKSEAALVAHTRSRNALQLQFSKKHEAAQREKLKRKDLQEQLKQAKDSLESHSADVGKLNQQIAEFTLREKDLQEEIHQLLGGEEEEDLPARSNSQRAEADEATGELKSEEANLKIQLSTLTGRLQVAGSNLAQLESRVSESLVSKQDWQRKRQSAEKRLGELQQTQAKLEKFVLERQNQLDLAAKTLEAKTQELAEAKQILGANAAKATENHRSKKLRDTIAALASHFPGVKGRLVDLIRPNAKKYALAVDTCLGRHMDSVVVETKQAAFECMKYLRENRLGTATFLPLDSLQPKPISESRRKLAVGPYSLCYDLIVLEDEAVDAAVRFAAGDAMVCETLEDARRLCFRNQVRVKAVTLEGHVISQRGEMTGGVMGDAGKQDRFAQAAAKSAKENCDRLEREIAELERVLDGQRGGGGGGEAQTELTACVGRVKFSQVTLKEAEDKSSQVEARLEEYRLESEQAEFKKRELEAEVGRTQSALRGVRERIAEAENQVFGDEDEDQGGDRKRRRREVEEREAKQLELKPIKDHLVTLQSQLRFITSKNKQDAVDQYRVQLEDAEGRIEQYTLEADEAKQRLDESLAQMQQLEAAKKRSVQQLELAEARAKELTAHLQSSLEGKSLAKKQVAVAEGELQRATLKRLEVIKQSALDGVELPRLEMEEDKFDFALLKRCKLKSDHEFAQKLGELREESASLMPNARAEARFQEASDRLKDCDGNLQQSREQSQVAEEAFERVREKRKEAFMKMFSHVSQKIDSVYKELTKRANSPLGGSAFLALEDEEGAFTAGIKFECMPPNKRYRAMEQLSGGEKTIAALALLFAIHTFRPSPFFVLDEVDAALDNDNVERVSNYIKMRSNRHGNEDEEFRPFQCLVISLKDGFFGRAEALVGVYRDLELDSSRPLTLDLSLYSEE
ncbi:hypothetical protein BASA81_010244 [Batrachochytrium salamandrivorans]|nr:hypothetical protein BASA81_010244 [Batrachochytrium salamandrivorans]